MLGRDPVGEIHGLAGRARQHDRAVGRQRLLDEVATRGLPLDFRGDGPREGAAPGEDDRPCVGIVFGLRDHVGRNPRGASAAGHDDDLGRARVEINRAVPGHQRFGRGDVAVARPHDLVDPRDGLGAVGQRSDRVCAADLEQRGHPGFERRGEHDRLGTRTHVDDVAYAGHTGRDGSHQERGGQRESAARHVAADPGERLHALLD